MQNSVNKRPFFLGGIGSFGLPKLIREHWYPWALRAATVAIVLEATFTVTAELP